MTLLGILFLECGGQSFSFSTKSLLLISCVLQFLFSIPQFLVLHILGDPGAVSRVGRKGATKVFKYGRKSPWVPTLTELFPKIQADAGS